MDYGQTVGQANRAREQELRDKLLEQVLDERRDAAERKREQIVYCRTRGGDYVPCR